MFSSIKNMRHITFFQRNLCFAYLAIIYCGILFQSAFAAVVITTGGNQQIPVGSPSTEVSFQVTDDFGNPNTNATITFKISSQLPDLGAGMAVKPSWETVETDSSFNGGIKVNDGKFLQQTVLTSADSVSFQGVINVDSDHIGMPADILVVGGYTPIDLPEQFVMVDDKNNTPNWDLDLTTLGPFARINSLPDQQPVNMYGGKLPIGKVRGWLGYRLDDGLIVFNGSKSINAQINEFVPPVEPPKKETDKTIDDNSSTGKENNEDDIVLPVEPTSLTISGSPVPFAYYTDFDASGFEYHFTPSITKVNNNDIVSFAIDNKPEWATFDDKTGIFRGMPSANDDGLYENVTITVTDGTKSQSLPPFEIEVKQWSGYGFCAAKNHEDKIICGPISDDLATKVQCESWAAVQKMKQDTAKIHIDEDQDKLERLAEDKNICAIREPTYDPYSQTCPAGYQVAKQDNGEPRCMEDLTDEEIAKRINDTMVRELDNYLSEIESEAIPDFTPLQPTLSEPDANGNRTLTLPPPVSVQNTLEKQRRRMDLEGELGDLGILTDCSALIDQGSGWNRSVCFSWNKPVGDNQFGAKADAMAYLRVSGEASASFSLTGYLFGRSEKIVNLFSKTQIYTLPDEVIDVANKVEDATQLVGQAQDVIEQAANQDPEETLKAILERPELLAQFEDVIDQAIIEALRQAQTEFEKAKAQIDEAISQTKAAIAEAKAQFEAAKAKLEEAKRQFNEAKALAQNALQTLNVDKTGFIAEFQIGGQTIDSYIKEAQAGEPLAFDKKLLDYKKTIFSINQDFAVGPIPVTVGASLSASASITLNGGIQNPLDSNRATAIVSATPELDVLVNAEGGVGNQYVAKVGVEAELALVDTDVEFSLLAQAKDFPEKPPLIIVDWAADFLNGSISLFAQVSETVMTLINAPAKVINWVSSWFGEPELVPEIKISRYEKKLFDWEGFHYPSEQSCQLLKPNRKIIYCSRPDECYDCVDNPTLLDEYTKVLDEVGNPTTTTGYYDRNS